MQYARMTGGTVLRPFNSIWMLEDAASGARVFDKGED